MGTCLIATVDKTVESPEVSICIPACNRPEEVRAAVASALGQTVTDLEVIVSDDSDRDQDLTAEIDDQRLRYHWNPERLGMAANWERAISLARGRYIGLLMDDDRLLPLYLERCLAAFEVDDKVGVVFTNHFFDDGKRVTARESLLREGTYTAFLPTLLRHKPVAVCATLMRRDVWDEVLPVPDLHTADMAMHVKAAQAGWPFHYVDEPLMIYRTNHSQLSGDLSFRDHEVELWRRFRFAPGSEEEELRRRRFAEALLSSAAGHMQCGEYELSEALASEARSLGLPARELSRRARLVAHVARSRLAMRSAATAYRSAGRLAAALGR